MVRTVPPFATAGFVRMIERAAKAAGLGSPSPHAPSCVRFALANAGQDTHALQAYLGHQGFLAQAPR